MCLAIFRTAEFFVLKHAFVLIACIVLCRSSAISNKRIRCFIKTVPRKFGGPEFLTAQLLTVRYDQSNRIDKTILSHLYWQRNVTWVSVREFPVSGSVFRGMSRGFYTRKLTAPTTINKRGSIWAALSAMVQ